MAIKKIIPREIQQIFMVGLMIFFFLLFLGGRWLQNRHIIKMKELKEERRRVELENKVAGQLSKLKKIREDLTVINESSRFLAEIAKIAGQLNLKIATISAVPIQKRDAFIQLGVTLELDTTYHECGLFISRLESADLLISVEKLEINSNITEESAKNPRVVAKLLVTTFALTDTILEK